MFHGSGSRRRSWNSIGSARAESIAALIPVTYAVASGCTCAVTAHAPRARRPGACRACASAGPRAARPSPANSDSRPAVARRKNSSCQSRSWPWQKPSANVTSCARAGAHVRNAEAVAQDVDGRLEPAQAQPAGGARQRPPEELVPEAGRAERGAERAAGGDPCEWRAEHRRRFFQVVCSRSRRVSAAAARSRRPSLPRTRRRAACQPFEGRPRDTRYANRSRRLLVTRATRCGARAAAGPWAPA